MTAFTIISFQVQASAGNLSQNQNWKIQRHNQTGNREQPRKELSNLHVNIYLSKVNNRNTRKVVNMFSQTLNMFKTYCFCCWPNFKQIWGLLSLGQCILFLLTSYREYLAYLLVFLVDFQRKDKIFCNEIISHCCTISVLFLVSHVPT